MRRASRIFICGLSVCALLIVASPASQASTIIKLDLGGVGPDVHMNAGILSTVDETGGPPPTGDQFTNVIYQTFLVGVYPNITTDTATFSMSGLQATGPPAILSGGTIVMQNFVNGSFSLYDPSDNLLLGGLMDQSVLSGVIGGAAGGNGSLFTTTLNNIDPASLLFPYIMQGTVGLSMTLSNVNNGSGFAITNTPGGPVLGPFAADAAALISAQPESVGPGVPEPASLMLVLAGAFAATCGWRRRGR